MEVAPLALIGLGPTLPEPAVTRPTLPHRVNECSQVELADRSASADLGATREGLPNAPVGWRIFTRCPVRESGFSGLIPDLFEGAAPQKRHCSQKL